ncbi:Clp protease N-terminal domain-containing protein [Actinomycetospora sp. NBRC 106378]|uniref:Clp protease N-terminal domain-containing protein n=1 Tax=Actinomycetospora sp. NBRC 106378 TaxID=3032208 RepID=UPI0024A1447C|nr:Clp protease N-terminal domain-containing protein [Actinomycetospora sp. NBRC 106378]GLZ51487.1 hypothetical protein Acsp07_11040 [Actinomycetospora sp. NBRC 106378]
MTAHGLRVPFWPGIATAREIAAAGGDRSVGTQHVLQALLRHGDTDAATILRTAGADEASVVAALAGIAGTGCRTGAVPTERIPVSPRVLALIRTAGHPSAAHGKVSDLEVLRALLRDDEPSLARLVLSALGAERHLLHALPTDRVDDGGGDLVGA